MNRQHYEKTIQHLLKTDKSVEIKRSSMDPNDGVDFKLGDRVVCFPGRYLLDLKKFKVELLRFGMCLPHLSADDKYRLKCALVLICEYEKEDADEEENH